VSKSSSVLFTNCSLKHRDIKEDMLTIKTDKDLKKEKEMKDFFALLKKNDQFQN
jgi:hypothetical protein